MDAQGVRTEGWCGSTRAQKALEENGRPRVGPWRQARREGPLGSLSVALVRVML